MKTPAGVTAGQKSPQVTHDSLFFSRCLGSQRERNGLLFQDFYEVAWFYANSLCVLSSVNGRGKKSSSLLLKRRCFIHPKKIKTLVYSPIQDVSRKADEFFSTSVTRFSQFSSHLPGPRSTRSAHLQPVLQVGFEV